MTISPDAVGTVTDTPARPGSETGTAPDGSVGYLPVLDVVRGTPAGYQAVTLQGHDHGTDRRTRTVRVVRSALAASSTLPTNTFISIPVPLDLAGDASVRGALRDHGDLAGVVLDVTDFVPDLVTAVEDALDEYRRRGALISVGGRESAQPELGSIVRLRPAIVRLGQAWVGGLDRSEAQRSAIEVTGRLAAQLDAWILAESVGTAGELRALAELGVPLAQGPFVGGADASWSDIRLTARTVLPPVSTSTDGVLRSLVQQAYTTHDLSAAQSVLPDTSGYETVVVIDDRGRPVSLLERGTFGRWEPADVLTVNVDTPVADVTARAMARPRDARFLPLMCTDAAGRFVGVLKIEDLVSHLATGTV